MKPNWKMVDDIYKSYFIFLHWSTGIATFLMYFTSSLNKEFAKRIKPAETTQPPPRRRPHRITSRPRSKVFSRHDRSHTTWKGHQRKLTGLKSGFREERPPILSAGDFALITTRREQLMCHACCYSEPGTADDTVISSPYSMPIRSTTWLALVMT